MKRNTKALFSLLFAAVALLSACDETAPQEETEERFFNSSDPVLEQEFAFNPALGETPESVATDFDGNLYVSLALTGEIAKIDSNGVRTPLAFLPLGNPQDCLGPFPGIMGAIAINPVTKDLYVPVNSCDLASKGVWRVSQDGSSDLVASLPPDALGNGIALRLGRVYVSDSASTRIFRAETSGNGSPAEVWTMEPLLADPDPFDIIPGANGLQFYGGKMWVANAGAASIVSIDLDLPGDGSGDIQPGDAEVVFGPTPDAKWVTDPQTMPGCDDFAFDLFGKIYCTTDPFQTVVTLNQWNGDVDVIFDATDGLDGPTAAAFGRGQDRNTLYISNANFPFFPSTGNGPSISKTELPVGGWPLR
jgi:hypothetical protein